MPPKEKQFAEYDYEAHLVRLREFVAKLRKDGKFDPEHPQPTTDVLLDDLYLFDERLATCFVNNTPTYMELLQKALYTDEQLKEAVFERLLRRTQFALRPSATTEPVRFRDVQPHTIGKFLTFRATATFVSQIVPEIQVATYYCENCQQQKHILVVADSFRPVTECDSEVCQTVKSALVFSGYLSKFAQTRVVIVQEPPDEIPPGATPRTLQCFHRLLPEAEAAGAAAIRPGDRLALSGYLMPVASAQSAYRIDQVFVVQSFAAAGPAAPLAREAGLAALGPEQRLDALIRSFAPAIYGHEMPKLACLCSLVGGCAARATDVAIRQNINLLLVGDPGVAKSQLLKFAAAVAERGVYISGRGATGAGLTAAIVRVPHTSDFSLEPGALVLADRGLCCIDEFDKLPEEDRAAIYEVLEQQTISIAKAGVSATLNARATVCAAANPRYAKWDPARGLRENVDLPEALISRFDCLFVVRDAPDEARDRGLGEHVARRHMAPGGVEGAGMAPGVEKGAAAGKGAKPPLPTAPTPTPPLSAAGLRAYLRECRQLTPELRPELLSRYVDYYVADRAERELATPRALLATVRLSQAVAKLRGGRYVDGFDVDAARALLKAAEESAGAAWRPGRAQGA